VAGSKIPQNVIDELSNDQDFLAMDEASQDEVMSQIESKFGHIQKPENFLQRALNATSTSMSSGIGMANPLAPMMTMRKMNEEMVDKNVQDPLLNFGTKMAIDPLSYGGPGVAKTGAKGVGNVAKKVFPYTSKESRVGFTKGVEKSLKSRRGALTRGYTHSLNKSKAKVDLSDILDEGSEITEFTMKEAQDLKNAISQGIPDAVKSGVKIDPKHFGDRRIAGLITERMKKADSEMAGVIDKYGKHAENFKSAIAPVKGIKGSENIFGSNLVSQMFRGGGMSEKSQVAMKEFAPKVAKKVSGAKLNENIFRGVRGTAVGGALYKIVPNVLKRAFLSEVSK